MRRPLFYAAVVVACALPRVASADEPIERVVVEDRGPNHLLLATGIATFGFSYAVSGWVGLTSPRASERFLVVPVAGPWIALSRRALCGERPAVPCDTERTYEGLLIADGILQGLGLAQIGYAFVKREKREVERTTVVPLTIAHGAGVAAVGTF